MTRSLLISRVMSIHQATTRMVGETINRVLIEPRVMTSVQDIVDAILAARSANLHLRVVGSGHSSPIIGREPSSSGTMFVSLRNPSFQYYIKHDGHEPLVTVGAGLHIGDNPKETMEQSLVYRLWQEGPALADIVGAIFQTIVGRLTVGSGGGQSIFLCLTSW
jgi:FAD binding domain